MVARPSASAHIFVCRRCATSWLDTIRTSEPRSGSRACSRCGLNPEQEAAVADEERLRKQLADEAYDHLEENTQNDPGLTTRILDRLCEGDVTHQQLADELGVELSDIQNACKRIRRAATIIRERHDERVAEEARKLLELEERAARPGGRRA
jgi:predicted metal-binding protein